MPIAMMDVAIVPVGTSETSLSGYVAACEQVLREFPDIQTRLNPMTTTLEGDLDRLIEAARRMHEAPFLEGVERVSTTIRIDDRRDAELSMTGKVAAVEQKLAAR